MPYEPDKDRYQTSPANRFGLGVRSALDLGSPMGSWTGLKPEIGAPLSGALWGAGAGLTYAALRKLLSRDEETSVATPTILGALAGAGLGVWSGQLQKGSAFYGGQKDQAIYAIRADPNITDAEAGRLVYALQSAKPDQVSRIIQLAAVGGLTALVASKVLGLGVFGSALAGGAAAYTFNNWTRKPKLI